MTENKEKLERLKNNLEVGPKSPETSTMARQKEVKLVESTGDIPLPREVEHWMEKIEKDPQQQKNISDRLCLA